MKRSSRNLACFLKVGYAKGPLSNHQMVYIVWDTLTEGLTTSGIYNYLFKEFLDTTTGGPIDAMLYRNYALRNCSITSMKLYQSFSPTVVPEVRQLKGHSDLGVNIL